MWFAQADWYYTNTVKAWFRHVIAIMYMNGVGNHVPAQVMLAYQNIYVCKCSSPPPLFFSTMLTFLTSWLVKSLSSSLVPAPDIRSVHVVESFWGVVAMPTRAGKNDSNAKHFSASFSGRKKNSENLYYWFQKLNAKRSDAIIHTMSPENMYLRGNTWNHPASKRIWTL